MLVDQFTVLQRTEEYRPFGTLLSLDASQAEANVKDTGSSKSLEDVVLPKATAESVISVSRVFPDRTSPRISEHPEDDLEFVRKITYTVNKKKQAVSWLIYKDKYYNDMCAVPLRDTYECFQENLYCVPYSGDDSEFIELDIPEIKPVKENEHFAWCHRRVGITKGKRISNLESFFRIFHPQFYKELLPYIENPPQVSVARNIFYTQNCQEKLKKPYVPFETYQSFRLKKGDIFLANPFETKDEKQKFTYWKVLSDAPEAVYYLDTQGTCHYIEDGIWVTQLSYKLVYNQLKQQTHEAMEARNTYCDAFCASIESDAQIYHWLKLDPKSPVITAHETPGQDEI